MPVDGGNRQPESAEAPEETRQRASRRQLLAVAGLAAVGTGVVFGSGSGPLQAAARRVTVVAGPTGPTGPSGPIGPTGAAGARGATGPRGATGIPGAPGADGAAGPTGPVGPTGADGVVGPAGITGIAGNVGSAGEVGATGLSGPRGSNGSRGTTGPTGPDGPDQLAVLTMHATGVFPAVTGELLTLTTMCPTGSVVVGYGYRALPTGVAPLRVRLSYPHTSDSRGWLLAVVEDQPTGRTVQLDAYCVGPGGG